MVGKSTIKLIKSLALKKYRYREKLFLVEGDKIVNEVIQSGFEIKELLCTSEFLRQNTFPGNNIEKISEVDKTSIKKASLLKSPQASVAVCHLPKAQELQEKLNPGLSVFLDGIQDPGNLGTIIRICDWFGIRNVYCTNDTVDLYNPKVIQASMGSFLRINLIECDFDALANLAKKSDTTIYGAFMDGANIYKKELGRNALLVMGNEGNGIRPEVKQLIAEKISIPNFSGNDSKAESLNVGVATAILCSEFKRPR